MGEPHDMDWALARLREGQKVRRAGWNEGEDKGKMKRLRMEKEHVYMTTPQSHIPFRGTEEDLAATDWEIAGKES